MHGLVANTFNREQGGYSDCGLRPKASQQNRPIAFYVPSVYKQEGMPNLFKQIPGRFGDVQTPERHVKTNLGAQRELNISHFSEIPLLNPPIPNIEAYPH